MKKSTIPYQEAPQLAKTDIAYATGDPLLQPFYAHTPELAAFKGIIDLKKDKKWPRKDLVAVLEKQYATLPQSPAVKANIQALASDLTFTVTTAHQPCLFLGPLYFIYKALTTINLAAEIEHTVQGVRIVPIFVLGSEDHDLEELNHVNVFGKKITWEPGVGGAVGSIPANTVAPALAELKGILGESDDAKALFQRIENAYTTSNTFADATQALLNEFFGHLGLVVLNMSEPALKRHFVPIIRQELLEQPAFRLVNDTISQLNELGFKTQAAPREINLFYLAPGIRERIVRENGIFKVLNTDLTFTEPEMMAMLEAHPEYFSPNVILRPVFQEIILPNLAYVGGGGELAYWLERKAHFEFLGVQFPMLVRRNSVLWLEKDAVKKLDKAGISPAAFFGDIEALILQFVQKNATGEVALAMEIKQLHDIYDLLAAKAAAIDPTLEKAVRAEEVKAVGALEQWESRLVRAEKQKHEVVLNQLRNLKEKLFPNNGLQERTDNFIPYMLKYGEAFLSELKTALSPFDPGFIILQPDDNQ